MCMCSRKAARVYSLPLLSLCARVQELDLLEWVQAGDHAGDSTPPLPHNVPLQELLKKKKKKHQFIILNIMENITVVMEK